MSVFGTRPEAIKMAPVVKELERHPDQIESLVCVTAQHREMLDQVLDLFSIVPDEDLEVMRDNQTPTQVASAVLARVEPILRATRPDWVLVQGDTTTVAAASMAAFYTGVRVGHVEAGLRTHDKWQPFPEEVNRRIAGVIADRHFAPTREARENLLREGIDGETILVTGNPVIDALQWVVAQPFDLDTLPVDRSVLGSPKRKLVLVTAHRRENHGAPLERICGALKDLATRDGDPVHIVYPVHLNPNVWDPVHRLLGDVPNVTLTPPLDYLPLVHLMKRAYLVLTDSGGIQEEAPGLGVPVLVLREVTERPEAVAAGTVRVVGTDRERIVAQATRLLDDAAERERMARAVNPYGDGRASRRIVASLLGEQVTPFAPGSEG
jgi:UDP-N-acetylglucosamine 2-epimerase (non-hydrolysing)